MSSLIIEVCAVEAVEPHPNADRMAVARVKGWRTCVRRDPDTGTNQFTPGDKCVYFPPDAVLPPELADRLGVTQYLAPLGMLADGVRPPGLRVRVSKLRGEASFGLIIGCENPDWEVGTDVAAFYGVTKYEPPPKDIAGESLPPRAAFHRYFDMENIRNFPDVLTPGEEVAVTEKIHGQNARLGLVREDTEAGRVWTWMAGSHDVRRRRFGKDKSESVFWRCFNPAVRSLLCEVSGCGLTPEQIDESPPAGEAGHDVVLFGERYGAGVQDMTYGMRAGVIGFRAFDITLDAKYLDWDAKRELFDRLGVESVPVLFRGPFDFATVEQLAEGPTTLCDAKTAGKFVGREGVVVSAVKERGAVSGRFVMERAQLKCISFGYLARKGGTEDH